MPVLRMKLAGAAAIPRGEPSGSRSLRLRADQSRDSGVGALSRRPASGASRVGRLVSSPGGFAPMLILGKRWRFLPIDVLHIFLWQNVRSCFNQRFPRSGGEVWGAADCRCHVSGISVHRILRPRLGAADSANPALRYDGTGSHRYGDSDTAFFKKTSSFE